MHITFTLHKDSGMNGFIDSFHITTPVDVGRSNFEVSSSTSSYIHLRQISRRFFRIEDDLSVTIFPRNITHFQFLDGDNNVIEIIDNKLQKPLMDGFSFKVASYTFDNSIFKSQTFRQKDPVIYKISIEDPLDFDSDDILISKKKRKKKEIPDLICPYCEKAFKQLSRHIKVCKDRPSDRPRPAADDNGFIPKKRNW